MGAMSDEQDERRIVLETLRESVKDPELRRWRIARYGREVFTDWGDVYRIEDDGTLSLVARAVSQ
jgi:hypothetical protein